MSVILDPATEQRIQREIARGPYTEPVELINRALDLLESQENWLLRNKEAIHERLTESIAQAQRGEVYSPEEVRALLGTERTEPLALNDPLQSDRISRRRHA